MAGLLLMQDVKHLQAKLLGQILHLRRFSSAVGFAKYRFR
jgi:hypothetical protein